MTGRVKYLFVISIAAAAIAAVAFAVPHLRRENISAIRLEKSPPAVYPICVSERPSHYALHPTKDYYDSAYPAVSPNPPPTLKLRGTGQTSASHRVLGAIVPHHLFVKDRIAAFFAGLGDATYDTVVVISPDHFGATHGKITMSLADWQTPFGTLSPDDLLVDALVRDGDATVDETPFDNEHGITGLVAFVTKGVPRAKFLPILLPKGASSESIKRLAATLRQAGESKRLLVIASVDFSHEVDAPTADKQDVASIAAITSFAFAKMSAMKLDSPASIEILTRYLQSIGATRSELLSATHTGRLLGHPEDIGTSHRIIKFWR